MSIDVQSVMSKQLSLGMWLRQGTTFASYVAGANAQLVNLVSQGEVAGQDRFVYLWGGDGVGKSHLLQAACHAATARGESSVYLPLREAAELAPEMLEGMEQMSVVAVDDIDAIASQQAWETALFHLYNRIRDQGRGKLLVTASQPLAALEISLPDLQSRLAWGLVFQIQSLTDDEKLLAMQQRADSRGFELSDEVGRYLLRHYMRDMSALFDLLERLDQLSLAQQRRLTIPFVKEVMDSR